MLSAQPTTPATLTVLYRLAETVLNAADEAEVLDLVVQAPIDVVQAHCVCLIPLSADGQVGPFVTAGPGAPQVQQVTRTELDEGLTGWVLRERRLAVSPATEDDPRESVAVRARRHRNGCGHLAVMPLQHRETVLGTLTVMTDGPDRAFLEEDLAWFEALANLAAVAMVRQRMNARLTHLAQFDALTDLPNWGLFLDRLTQTLARTVRHQTPCAVVYVNLDGFRPLNVEFGHEVGNQVLCTVAQRLQAAVRATDTVARLDGDTFAVILSDLTTVQDALLVAEKLRLALGEPLRFGTSSVQLSASLGVSLAPLHGQTARTLCRLADQAVNQAKRHGGNMMWLASARVDDRLAGIKRDLPGALERGEFSVHFQEQFGPSGARVGFEALARWTSPRWGSVPPTEFIPLCEAGGMIIELGAWILQEATGQLARWRAEQLTDGLMAVNVSPIQLLRPDFEDRVRAALLASGLPGAALELELTENFVASHLTAIAPRLQALRQLGVRIALDDFGAGASVLSELVTLPLDTLKIDRSFLRDEVPKARQVMGVIAALGEALGLTVVLEGVERPEHLTLARDLGCERTQGYLQGRPMPAEAVGALLLQTRLHG